MDKRERWEHDREMLSHFCEEMPTDCTYTTKATCIICKEEKYVCKDHCPVCADCMDDTLWED